MYLLTCLSEHSIGLDELTTETVAESIADNYEYLLSNKVTADLLANHKAYQKYPNKYWSFLSENFLPNWNFDYTTKALIGKKIFNSLSSSQFLELSRTLEITLVRYAFESLFFYGKQKLNVIDINVNGEKNFAWMKINMQSPRLPDVHLDLLLKRTNDNYWRGVDFRFKGITYVELKKNSFRQDFEDFGFEGFVRKLADKNRSFFSDLCERNINYLDPNIPPCV